MRPGNDTIRPAGVARRICLAAALAALAGCATVPSGSVPRDVDERQGAAAGMVRTPPAEDGHEPAASDAGGPPADSGAGETDPFTLALLERRRRDYPEFETTETGFTITEQVRIASGVRDDYQRAMRYLQQEQYEQGIALLLAVTETAPELTAPYIDLGIAYRLTGELELAESALLNASQLSPDHPIVSNELGIVYRQTGRFQEAKASYERALEIYPSFHFARRNLAVLCDLYLADLACAREHYEAYLDAVVEDEAVEIWVADIRNRLGQ